MMIIISYLLTNQKWKTKYRGTENEKKEKEKT